MNFEATIRDLLARGVAVRFRASGDSMHPTIRCGEHIHLVPLQLSTLARGQVVLARQERGLTAHRVVRVERTGGRVVGITTRGDNALTSDPIILLGALLGRVERVERNGVAAAVSPVAPPRLHVFARRMARLVRRASRLSSPPSILVRSNP